MAKQKNAADKLAAKKQMVEGKRSNKSVLLGLVSLVVLVGAGAVFFTLGGQTGSATSPALAQTAESQPSVSGEIRYPAEVFADGQARHYEHRAADGILVKYFIVKAPDGVIRAAFDACDACWRAGKGYAQDGEEMVCGNCRMRFPTDQINEVKGGCNPSPLERTMEGDEVVVQVSDIEKGSRYFTFPKRKKQG